MGTVRSLTWSADQGRARVLFTPERKRHFSTPFLIVYEPQATRTISSFFFIKIILSSILGKFSNFTVSTCEVGNAPSKKSCIVFDGRPFLRQRQRTGSQNAAPGQSGSQGAFVFGLSSNTPCKAKLAVNRVRTMSLSELSKPCRLDCVAA